MGRARIIADLVGFSTDSGVLNFGADKEITLTHDPDDGLILKHAATADDSFPELTFQTGDTDIAVNDLLGRINFQAPDEGAGTDAILVAGAIAAISEGDFSSSANATSLIFQTGASETATTKMTLSSGGNLDVTGDITGSTLNADGDTAAGDNAAIGFTSTEGLILTGQGSTNDVTIKNDADADVIEIPTGTVNVTMAGDVSIGDDLLLLSDAAVLNFGADSDVTLTHVADTGLLLSGTNVIQFNDASQNIGAPSNAILDINATDEIELNATLCDVNANLDVSGTIVGASTLSATTITASTAFVPDASDGAALGTTSLEFSDLFLADGAVINLGADQDVKITHVADTGVLLNAASVIQFRDSAINIGSSADGQLDIAADTEVEITTALVEISADATVGDDLTLKSDAAVLGFGADTDVTLTHVADTGLLLNAASVIQFRDSAINIGSPADGDLDINADDEIELNSTLVDLNGNLDVSGTIVGASTLSATTGTFSGVLKTDNTTNATSTTDGSLQTDGGLSVALDAVIGDDLFLLSDSAVLNIGADSDLKITHDGTNGDFESAGNLVFDVAGDITLDAAGLDVNFAAGGSNFGLIKKDSTSLIFRNPVSDGPIKIEGSDGGSNQTYIEINPASLEGVYAFHGNGTAGNPLGMTNYNDVNGTTLSFNTSSSGKETQTFRLNGTQVGSIVITSSTAYNTSSDYRLKQNVEYDWDATTECKKLKPCQFKWIEDVAIEDDGGATAQTITGFLAHELQTVVPEAVSGVKDATETYINDDGDSATRIKPQLIDQSKIIAILTKTIQELEARITALE